MLNENKQDFVEMINYLAGMWPSINNAMRTKRIYESLKFLPKEAFFDIADMMIDNYRQMPTPEDFRQAAKEWKKNHLKDSNNEIIEITPIKCNYCYETGYIFCKLNNDEPVTLVYCECEIGKEKSNKYNSCMPRWDKKFEPVYGFIKLQFPYKDFIPNNPKSYIDLLNDCIVKSWKEKIKNAHAYWDKKNKEAKK